MADEAGQEPTAASPYATGGGGTRFEHRLGTVLLVRLLTAQPVFELAEQAPERVAFQQAPAASVDDLVVTARAADGAPSVRLDIAVRRTPNFVRSDTKTAELVKALVRADLAAERSADPLVERRLAVAVSGRQTHAQEIAELAVVARGQSNADEFVELVRTPRKWRLRRPARSAARRVPQGPRTRRPGRSPVVASSSTATWTRSESARSEASGGSVQGERPLRRPTSA